MSHLSATISKGCSSLLHVLIRSSIHTERFLSNNCGNKANYGYRTFFFPLNTDTLIKNVLRKGDATSATVALLRKLLLKWSPAGRVLKRDIWERQLNVVGVCDKKGKLRISFLWRHLGHTVQKNTFQYYFSSAWQSRWNVPRMPKIYFTCLVWKDPKVWKQDVPSKKILKVLEPLSVKFKTDQLDFCSTSGASW